MSIFSKFTYVIYHARKEMGLTQADVADGVHVSPRWYQMIEKGIRKPSGKLVLNLISFLRIDGRSLADKLSEEESRGKKKKEDWMEYRYLMIKDVFWENGEPRTGYGIMAAEVVSVGNEIYATVLTSIKDICPDPERMHQLIRLCNSLELYPRHLAEVVEDFLLNQ